VVFEADTPAGRAFDLALIVLILLSVLVVSVETVRGIAPPTRRWLRAAEWAFTVLFSVEYALRLTAVRRPLAYATSFFGVVDLLAILPTYLSLVVPGTQALLVVRVLRLLRVFRVLKLAHFLSEARARPGDAGEPAQDHGFPAHRVHDRRGRGLAHVRHRGARERVHEHPGEHVLGGGDAHHGGLR